MGIINTGPELVARKDKSTCSIGCARRGRLDEEAFPAFEKFLSACQDYAKFSGCRFSLASFEGIECSSADALPIVSEVRSRDTGALLGAKLRAAPMVTSFANMLKMGDLELQDDLVRALEIVTQESVRNAMIAKCKALEIFPPLQQVAGVLETDCDWEDISAPLTSIAWRLYNDECQRVVDSVDGVNPTLRRAKTASFLVEFADELGCDLPQMPQRKIQMLQEFENVAMAWTSGLRNYDNSSKEFLGCFFQDAGDMANAMHRYIDSRLLYGDDSNCQVDARSKTAHLVTKHRDLIRASTAFVALAGATGLASLRLLQRT